MRRKKMITTLLAIALILSMAACSSEEPVKETSNKSTEATAVQEESNQEETEELPEENPEESETEKEETKKEQADNQSTPESDTMELEGAPAQGSAVPFPLQTKISVKTSESNQWFSFTTENNTNYQVTLLPGDQYHHSIQLKFYNTSGEEVWSANTEGNGSATVKEVDLEKILLIMPLLINIMVVELSLFRSILLNQRNLPTMQTLNPHLNPTIN